VRMRAAFAARAAAAAVLLTLFGDHHGDAADAALMSARLRFLLWHGGPSLSPIASPEPATLPAHRPEPLVRPGPMQARLPDRQIVGRLPRRKKTMARTRP